MTARPGAARVGDEDDGWGWWAFFVSLLPIYWWLRYAVVLPRIWGWFFVPLGLPVLGWRTFFAAALLVGSYRSDSVKSPRKTGLESVTNVLVAIVVTLVAWGMAAMVRP